MNSYQTINAAFAAAGLTKQAAVNFGRRYEAGLWDPFGHRSLFDMLVELQTKGLRRGELIPMVVRSGTGKTMFGNARRVDHDPVGRWNAEDKQRQLKVSRVQDSVYVDVTRKPWDQRVYDLQNKGTVLRDQSEDRPTPKFLVEGFGLSGGYRVVRARDRKTIVTFTGHGAAEQATEQAVLFEDAAA